MLICSLLTYSRDLTLANDYSGGLEGEFRKKLKVPLERGKPYVFAFWWASNYVNAARDCYFSYWLGGGYAGNVPMPAAPNPRYGYRYVEFPVTLDTRNIDLSMIRIGAECAYTDVPASQDSIDFYFDDLIIR
jgi:hypothetical protein